jgi:ribosome-associated protein
VVATLKENGFTPPRVEGFPTCDWVLIDAGDLIIHVFRPEVRSFYNLEKMWGASRPSESVQEQAEPARKKPARRRVALRAR